MLKVVSKFGGIHVGKMEKVLNRHRFRVEAEVLRRRVPLTFRVIYTF